MVVNLSDPEGSGSTIPISWPSGSTRAMSNRRTPGRRPQKCRLQICHLLDRSPAGLYPLLSPDPEQIRITSSQQSKQQMYDDVFPMRIKGKVGGCMINDCKAGDPPVYTTTYHNFSDDGKSYYNGHIAVIAPPSLFAVGKTIFEADLTVEGEHQGEMKLRAVFNREGLHAPAMLSFAASDDGLPESRGWSTYDGVTLRIEDMEP